MEARSIEDLDLKVARRLVANGTLERRDLDRARRLQSTHSEDLRLILEKLGLITEEAWARSLAEALAVPFLAMKDLEATELNDALPVQFMSEHRVLLIRLQENSAIVAMADPTDSYARRAVELALGRKVGACVATSRDIEAVLRSRAGEDSTETFDTDDMPDDELPDTAGYGADDDDVERLRGLANEAPVIRFVNELIRDACRSRASDIHLEPFEKNFSLRLRIDGLLSDIAPPPQALEKAVISRLKLMANMDIAERRLPQDGRIRFRFEGQQIDLRVSCLPSLNGESLVIRILEQDGPPPEFSNLGLPDHLHRHLHDQLSRKSGMLLVTGPTGSGKTTTLYAGLNLLNQREAKIVTIEDPVEFQIRGIVQTQVKADIGMDFSRILRSIVRQDPDVIMVGEMRDAETARIASQSALTGHLVLSTLHTNDAVSAVTRLLDMGIENYLLTSTLNAVLAQRLVRVLCPECKEAVQPDPQTRKFLSDWLPGLRPADMHICEPRGCDACQGRGYNGRMGVFELFLLDTQARGLIMKDAGYADLFRHAHDGAGMQTMFENGLEKVVAGLTTIEELRRVAQDTAL